jgi:hypothetical protein
MRSGGRGGRAGSRQGRVRGWRRAGAQAGRAPKRSPGRRWVGTASDARCLVSPRLRRGNKMKGTRFSYSTDNGRRAFPWANRERDKPSPDTDHPAGGPAGDEDAERDAGEEEDEILPDALRRLPALELALLTGEQRVGRELRDRLRQSAREGRVGDVGRAGRGRRWGLRGALREDDRQRTA